MADEEVVVEQAEEVEQGPTVLEAVKEEMAKDAPDAETKTDEVIKKGPVKLSAQERVRQALDEKKAAEAKAADAISQQSQLSEKVNSLEQELSSIKQRLETGQITKQEAREEVKTAEDLFKEAIDSVELSEDLKPYRQDIAMMAQRIAQTILDAELKPIREQFRMEQERKAQADAEAQSKALIDSYSKVSKNYADLFEPEPGEDGLPVLKPEFDKEAMEILKDYYYPVYDNKGNKVGDGNKLLESERGLETLMTLLHRRIEQQKLADLENEQTRRIKSSRVEGPESRRTSSEPKSILDITRETMKEFN